MANVRENVLFFSFLLYGNLNRVCSKKWSYFNNGCETASGRIAYLSNLHLSHCTAECNAHDKCKVFGYSSSDKRCLLFDETFLTTSFYSCSSKTTRFYTDSTTLPNSTPPHSMHPHSTLPKNTHLQSTLPTSTLPHSTLPLSTHRPLTTITTTFDCENVTDYSHVTSLNKCIRYHSTDRLIWEDAREVCENEGAHLIYVQTQEVLDYIESFMEADNNKFWIDGKQVQVGSKTFEWLSGETIDNTTGGHLWLPNRPAVDNPTYNYCLETKRPQDKTLFGFFDRQCTSVRKFFCEVDII